MLELWTLIVYVVVIVILLVNYHHDSSTNSSYDYQQIEPPRNTGLFDYVFGGSGNNNDEGDSGSYDLARRFKKGGLNCDPFKDYFWNLNKFIYSKKFLVRVKQIKIFVN